MSAANPESASAVVMGVVQSTTEGASVDAPETQSRFRIWGDERQDAFETRAQATRRAWGGEG